MSDYPKPAGLDTFRACGVDGCEMDVYAPLGLPIRCRDHGGPGYPQFRRPDPFGNTRSASATDPSPVAPRPSAA
jgi:hypothetical protein